MVRTRLGISLRIVDAMGYEEKRDAVSHDWIVFSEKMGFIPILIPNKLSNIGYFLKEMDIKGIVLSGGDNIGDDNERDRTEKEIIEYGIKSKTPIFGVCRGMQVLNKYFGGSLTTNSNSNHVERNHEVKIVNEAFCKLLETDSIVVNSFHNNFITKNNLGPGLEPFAKFDKDNTIEGFFHSKYLISGVMWHPERDQNDFNKSILKKSIHHAGFWNK